MTPISFDSKVMENMIKNVGNFKSQCLKNIIFQQCQNESSSAILAIFIYKKKGCEQTETTFWVIFKHCDWKSIRIRIPKFSYFYLDRSKKVVRMKAGDRFVTNATLCDP